MSCRRLIGRRFDDPTVKKDMESWPFKVVDDNGNPKVEVQYLGSTHTFSPQEISAMVLTKVSFVLFFISLVSYLYLFFSVPPLLFFP